uniref:Zinc transporter 9 n=1 Tax=Acrobeloides nanus TaxID=290746 RepID=A0A914EMD8_9BILA
MLILKGALRPLGKNSLHTCLITLSAANQNDYSKLKTQKLFKAARAKNLYDYGDDKIDLERAIAEFNLREEDLLNLPKAPSDPKSKFNGKLYYAKDVHDRAIKRNSATTSGDRAVFVALCTNFIDTISKFIGAYFTGSLSLFSEFCHSLCDTFNTIVLYLGNYYSKREADIEYPYGTGNVRYLSALCSGGLMFCGGGLYSIYSCYTGIVNPSSLELSYAPIFLIISCVLQGISAANAYREAFKHLPNEKMSLVQKVKFAFSINDPTHRLVIVEDSAALVGFGIALSALSASYYFQTSIFDAAGSGLIGVLLCFVGINVIRVNVQQLLMKSVPQEKVESAKQILLADPSVRAIYDVKATRISAEHDRFKAEIDWNGREITKLYLKENCNLEEMFNEVKKMEKLEQFEEFMLHHGDQIVERIGDEVNRLEKKLQTKHPELTHVDLESN